MSPCNHDDLLDLARGDLSPERAGAVEEHAETCAPCAQELRWLRTERALFRKPAMPPSTHVWQGIERRLVISLEQKRVRRHRMVQVGAASTVVAAAASFVLFLWGHGAQVGTHTQEPQGLTRPTSDPRAEDRAVAPEAFESLEVAEAQVKSAISRLERVYEKERDKMDPEDALRVDEELRRLKHVLSAEKSTAEEDVWARRRLLRAYSTYMRTMQAMVLEVPK